MTLPDPVENGLAAAKIAEESPEAVGVLVMAMDANARHLDSIEGMVRHGLERERDEWMARALDAEERLRRIEDRIWDLLG